ncbi:hypothetical protein GQ457_08G028400 [Hibiscus cannabinus]
MSSPEFAGTIPVSPPMVNKKMNPTANNMGVLYCIEPPHMVAIQLKILIPMGTAMIMVAARFAVVKLTASLSTRAKLRPRLLVASGRLIPSPEIQVNTGKDLLIPRGRAGLEASYLSPISPHFLL